MGHLSESVEEFKDRCRNWIKENDPKFERFPKWLWVEFMEYWTQKNDGGRKYFFQMEKKWSTGGRIATFLKFAQSRNDQRLKAFKVKQKEILCKPTEISTDNYGNIDYEAYKKRIKRENKPSTGNIIQFMPHNKK